MIFNEITVYLVCLGTKPPTPLYFLCCFSVVLLARKNKRNTKKTRKIYKFIAQLQIFTILTIVICQIESIIIYSHDILAVKNSQVSQRSKWSKLQNGGC